MQDELTGLGQPSALVRGARRQCTLDALCSLTADKAEPHPSLPLCIISMFSSLLIISTQYLFCLTHHHHISIFFMQVLSGKTDSPDLPENVNWVSRAMMVYRQGLSHGLRPSLKVLDRLLSCLRLPFIPPLAHGLPSHAPRPQHKVGSSYPYPYVWCTSQPMPQLA